MSNQTQISTFNFESNSIRTLAINDEPWFVAADICKAINLSSPSMAIANLDEDEKYTLSLTEGIEGIGKQVQELNLVSESGMYTLILRCRDAVKKGSIPHRFRKWVTAEVLPQIRKTGKYQLEAKQLALPEPTVDCEFKEAMIKILNYAHQFEQFQKSITSSINENRKKQIEFLFSEIADGDSYLFVFKNSISQDIQKASDMLFSLVTR